MTDPHAENKRLYALDEAAVGKKHAIQRWQIWSDINGWIKKVLAPPDWLPDRAYRRDPEAPPLPSLDWHEARADQMWRVQDKGDKPTFLVGGMRPQCEYDFVEYRPNPEWFELTRPDYEASKEDDMDEYLTGPALHRAIADAMENGEGPEVFERWYCISENWGEPRSWADLILANEGHKQVRRKPKMRHLIDAEGNRWEWPEPLKHHPVAHERYFAPSLTSEKSVALNYWLNDALDKTLFDQGMCHKTEKAAAQHARALIAASGGNDAE